MAYGIGKKDNEYARALADIDAPKTVWMAIAYALAHRAIGTDPEPEQIATFIREEWTLLYQNHIVPQKPR